MNALNIVFEARRVLERGEPLPVDMVIKLRKAGVDPDRLAALYNL